MLFDVFGDLHGYEMAVMCDCVHPHGIGRTDGKRLANGRLGRGVTHVKHRDTASA